MNTPYRRRGTVLITYALCIHTAQNPLSVRDEIQIVVHKRGICVYFFDTVIKSPLWQQLTGLSKRRFQNYPRVMAITVIG